VRWWVLIGVLVVVQAFIGNAATHLWDEDEAAYAAFARTMIRTGDWVVPHFLWSDAHRKTPLLFWCIAVLFKAFGEHEWAVRLPTTLAVLGTVAAVGWLGRRIAGRRAALFAALILVTNLFVPNLGKVAVTDALVLLSDALIGFALFALLETRRWRYAALFWSSLAFGLLAKGPPSLLLAGGLVLWVLLVDPRRRTLWKLQPWFGLPLAFVPVVLWGVLAWQRTDGALLRWMWRWYIAKRIGGGTVFGQVGPPGYYLVLMLLGFMPWGMLLPLALSRGRTLWRDLRLRYLLGWLVFGWFVWEAFPSKLPAYALGAYPAVALLLGRELDQLTPEITSSAWLRVGAGTLLVVTCAIPIALCWGSVKFLDGGAAPGVIAAIFLWGIGILTGLRATLGADPERAARAFALGSLGFLIALWVGVVPAVDARRATGADVVRAVDALDPERKLPVLFAENFHLPSVPFYVGRDRMFEEVAPACRTAVFVSWQDKAGLVPRVERSIVVPGWNPDGNKHFGLAVQLSRCGAKQADRGLSGPSPGAR
jgi:4-amino-4-deoxy-L-arabinose transferase-like glycosyltransferase